MGHSIRKYFIVYYNFYIGTEVTLSSLQLVNATTTTLSVTWSAGYPKCYSFTVSYSTQDSSINVTQPVNSAASHTLTSLQPGTTYSIEVEAMRKGDGAGGQRAKVIGTFATHYVYSCEKHLQYACMQLWLPVTSHACIQCVIIWLCLRLLLSAYNYR